MRTSRRAAACLALALLCAGGPGRAAPSKEDFPSLWDTYRLLASKKFVDLTHAFEPGSPHWRGYPDEKRKSIYKHARDGFWVERYQLVGQWGTHADPPSHFHPELRSLDAIPVNEMVAPLVVIDVSARARKDPDVLLGVDDIKAWEARYGRIPDRAFVAMRTDWSKRWPDQGLMDNLDKNGILHYPGWSVEALKLLVEDRNVTAIGHETSSTDPGFNVSALRYPAQAYIHGANRYQVELLTNLDQVPQAGALAIVTFPKPKNGSGFPARVFAILP